ncbi:AAA family ATPase [Streptomyces sp. NPDC005498]|uniref:AAA family ATPase n=1 Tax=Streptomyces sp. NPDC005498 TaxID=3364717 RepID=UPI0036AF2944
MPLVGRDRQAAAIRTLIGRLRTGSGGALVLTGEPGIGKSALLDHVVSGLDDVRVLTAAAPDAGDPPPYAALRRLLPAVRDVRDRLPAPQRAALASVEAPDADGAKPLPVALAMLNLLAEAASRSPVILVAEDLHRWDKAGFDALAFVARRLASEPVVLLGASRESARDRVEDTGLPVLPLGPLDAADAKVLVDRQAPGLSPGLRERILSEAAGNPLVLVKLTRVAHEAYGEAAANASWLVEPEHLRRAPRTPLAALPRRTRLLLLAMAAHDGGSRAEILDMARTATGAEPRWDDLGPALRAGLVSLDDGTVHFRHPLARASVLSESDLPQRGDIGKALACAPFARPVAGTRGAQATRPAEARPAPHAAFRRDEGGPPDAASTPGQSALLPRVGDRAPGTGRHEGVVGLLGRAAEQPLSALHPAPPPPLPGRTADGAESATDNDALIALSERLAVYGDGERALRVLETAASRIFWARSTSESGRRVADAAERLPADDEPRVLAILAAASPVAHGAKIITGLDRWATHPSGDPVTDQILGEAALMAGSYPLAASFSAASLPGLRAQGRLRSLAKGLCAQALSAALLCDLAVATPAAAEAARLGRDTDQPLVYATALATQALIAVVSGRPAEARALADEAVGLATALRVRPVLVLAEAALAHIAAAEGRLDDAFSHLQRLHDPAGPAFHPGLSCHWVTDLADIALRAHRTVEIEETVDRMEQAATLTPATALHTGVRFARAVLAHDDADTEQHFARALGADLTRWPFARARTQLAHGEWLRRRRRDVQARTPLRAARDAFDALGATAFADRAREELRASGEAGPERAPNVRDLLSPQELQIAFMVAEGLTNREIGERLYLSHRTVSSHLHRVFPKIGVTSRTALGRVLRSVR